MKLPRDVSGSELGKALRVLGYELTRQRGSHMRYTTQREGEHHVVIPDHNPMKLGTFHGILKDVATHHRVNVEELVRLLGL
jgi:predicted RNA binding protein YcfA (HicA-like mRNA interferase family)